MAENLEFDTAEYQKSEINIENNKIIYTFCNKKSEYAGRVFYTTNFQSNKIEFDRNITTLKGFDYPTVLKVFGYNTIEEEGVSYPMVITEFMKRKSFDNLFVALQHRCESRSWSDTKKYITTIGIAYAIKYLHSKDFIHRNLRPSKILFDKDYYPHVSCLDTLIDPDENVTESFYKSDSIEYLAPELLNDPQDYSKSTDIYAYSIIVYMLLTGKSPFRDPKSIRCDIEKQNYPNVDEICDELSSFFKCCWYNEPSSRPSIEEIIDLLVSDDVKDQFGNVDYNEIDNYIANLDALDE